MKLFVLFSIIRLWPHIVTNVNLKCHHASVHSYSEMTSLERPEMTSIERPEITSLERPTMSQCFLILITEHDQII